MDFIESDFGRLFGTGLSSIQSMPKEILKRGYSITYNDKGKIIKSSKKLARGDRLVTQLSDGKVQSKVE